MLGMVVCSMCANQTLLAADVLSLQSGKRNRTHNSLEWGKGHITCNIYECKDEILPFLLSKDLAICFTFSVYPTKMSTLVFLKLFHRLLMWNYVTIGISTLLQCQVRMIAPKLPKVYIRNVKTWINEKQEHVHETHPI